MRNFIFLFLVIFISCQEEITLDLPQAEEKVVVEGAIENGFPPYVILSKNQGYFDPIDSNTYQNLFIKDASVKVWTFNEDGSKDSIILDEISLPAPPPLNEFSVYTDLSGTGQFIGQEGKTYFLEIIYNNEIITSQTTIPILTPLDSVWIEKDTLAEEEYKYEIFGWLTDDASVDNYILSKSKMIQHYEINKEECIVDDESDFAFKLIDAGSDILFNGTSFQFPIPKPPDNGGFPFGSYNTTHTQECEDGTILSLEHDVVLLKFCQIDEPSMKFWRGLSRASASGGNPFSEPLNLVSNINGGLGAWTGYGAVYYKIPIIPNTVILEDYKPENTFEIF
tara:strand:+ start:1003 stop:2013 length:1011 start_codon:yes stop_codon:yes gene_type:complete